MADLSAFTFPSGSEELLGLIHTPMDKGGDKIPSEETDRGVLIVVGGPQYRVGAHRQFIHMARSIASAGLPVMRFDYTGMGDSSGEFPGFENVGNDVEAAVNEMKRRCPAVKKFTVWGLCDGASVALMNASKQPGVDQLVLVNPWVWSEDNEAATITRHYYAKRLVRPDFWRNVFSGRVNILPALKSFLQTILSAAIPQKSAQREPAPGAEHCDQSAHAPYQDLMAAALAEFGGRVLILLSGNDLVARDFEDRLRRDKRWRSAIRQSEVDVRHIEQADHTFSRSDWKKAVAKISIKWIKNDDASGGAA